MKSCAYTLYSWLYKVLSGSRDEIWEEVRAPFFLREISSKLHLQFFKKVSALIQNTKRKGKKII